MMSSLRFFSATPWPLQHNNGSGDLRKGWEQRSLPQLLPVLLGVLLGVISAVLIAEGQWFLAIPLVLLVPLVVLFIRYPLIAIVLMILVFPIVRGDTSAVGVLSYWLLYRIAVPMALAIAILSDWLGIRRRPTVRFGIAELFMVYFLLLGALSILVLNGAPPRTPIRFYDYVVVPFCAYWLVRVVAPDEKDLRRLAWVGLIVVVAQSAVGFVSWFAPQGLPAYWLRVPGRTSGTFGSPHPYTITLTFLSLLLLHYAVESKRGLRRFVFLSAVVIGFIAVFFSFSRGSWAGAVLVLVGLIVRYPRAMVSFIPGLVIAGYVLGLSVLSQEAGWAWDRLTTERTVENRIVIYAAALRMVEEKPVLGWGFGNFELYDEKFKGRVGNIPADLGAALSSHNAYLTIVVENGALGLALYAFPAFWWLVQSIRTRKKLPRHGFLSSTWLLLLWLAILQQFTVSNFTDMFGNQPYGTTLWWVVLGLIASAVDPYVGGEKRRFAEARTHPIMHAAQPSATSRD